MELAMESILLFAFEKTFTINSKMNAKQSNTYDVIKSLASYEIKINCSY